MEREPWLIKCAKCGQLYPPSLLSCPNCGYPTELTTHSLVRERLRMIESFVIKCPKCGQVFIRTVDGRQALLPLKCPYCGHLILNNV